MDDWMPNLGGLAYVPRNFADIAGTPLGIELWAFLKRPDNIVRLETATLLERPAAEALGPALVQHFGTDIGDDRIKQMIGHMIRQIMEARGFELDRKDVRITRIGLFTSAASYRREGKTKKLMNVTADQRAAWVQNTERSPFNVWLDGQVRRLDGSLDLDKLYEVARQHGVEERYDHLNAGQQRMNIGNRLRSRVKL